MLSNNFSILFGNKLRFITALTLKFCIFWFIFVSWRFLNLYFMWLIGTFIWSFWIKRSFWFIIVFLNHCWAIIDIWFLLLNIWFYILGFITCLKDLRIIMFLIDFGHIENLRFFQRQWFIKGFICRFSLQFQFRFSIKIVTDAFAIICLTH